ncbi:DsbA family oxidoreductase [Micromonospora parathelypteridis]|uniref:Putative DsbA family dithiol-disulfide isomerase n=1 Tax=Micromonospora parathelypteridis TaxID=1839617 RepID=A0A840VVP5_9ACTN|nr:DsbA family oxidoreductase [Micromonospora parathelypteridis]MBB5481322.1 putative DsbA family dithiol-disulfide isomerase [Micromonospora parathelypteridis]GGO19069.1 DSBA oxidoreductase [Micromonospora parathelypteridis]
MKIEFWSDIVCPYCGLMDHRLHQALDRFPYGDQVQVIHRSFQLHPDLPRAGVSQRELITMAGAPATTVDQVLRPIERAAEAEGLTPYHAVDRTLGPTDFAHELLAYATDQGRGSEIWTAMFRAHFGQARKLWTAEEVLDFAAEVGLDRAGAAEALRSRRYRARVAADQREAQRLGARGAPFLVFDGRFAVPGAIGLDDLLAVITKAWAESHPTPQPLPLVGDAEGMCAPDGCVVPDRTR